MHVINYILLLFITMQMMTIIRRVVITPAKYTPTKTPISPAIIVGIVFCWSDHDSSYNGHHLHCDEE